MKKATWISVLVVLVGLVASYWVMMQTSAQPKAQRTPELQGLLECAAYYELSTETINRMQVPQMMPVAGRLAQSAAKARELLRGTMSETEVNEAIAQAKDQQLASLPDPNSLRPLMAQYQEPCKAALNTAS
ncbi:hypothetical protein [Ferrimonas marina]|uniref:Uncharacterized protein n=1 Tax=Ferrimonas marina TaxID=299255 RepID=A0A1M5MI82_9GAMM|nr:hypothetical protein [Ferrimonas marina]SHG76832.1 hypothetical protein SAMN02745129_0650 [Ferrimonas marina]